MATAAPPDAPSAPTRATHRARGSARVRVWRRRVTRVVLAALAAFLVWFGISFGTTLADPGYGTSLLSRAAEWGRDHGLGAVVNWAEAEWYRLHPPRVGGRPPRGSFSTAPAPTVRRLHVRIGLPLPVRLVSPAGAWLPGEGVWHPAGRDVDGVPAILTTTVRPDDVHTSYVVGVAWMDTRLLSARLYSGSEVPGGGPFRWMPPITPSQSTTLDAAFNAGFRMQDADGGYYTDHRVVVPLRAGGASLVIYRDGSVAIGEWGSQVTMTPQVESVRQNLDLIVVHSHPVAGLTTSDNWQWGGTLNGAYYVWRSGIGVTKDGALVYVGGPSLAITSLADLLVDAGCVRGMELDINTDWVQFSTYRGARGRPVDGANGTSLLPTMAGDPWRYFETWWIRDFFTMSVRPAPDDHPVARLP